MSYLSFEKLNQHLDNYHCDRDFFVVDKKVYELHKSNLSSLNDKHIFFVENPEAHKSFEGAESLLCFLLEKGLKRNGRIVAIGGGALSDLAGYAAGVALRGVAWDVVPTTLLSLVDASIGGKTGINTPFGKNTVGCFHAPKEQHICLDFLQTLPQEEENSGKGEVLKYSILSQDIFSLVIEGDMEKVIEACRNYKSAVVEKDFYEAGERAKLNLGHTFGHALEVIFQLPHGIAVAMGMELVIALEAPGLLEKFHQARECLGLKYKMPKETCSQEFFRLLSRDKKNEDDEIALIVPEGIGKARKAHFQPENIKEKLNELYPNFFK